MGSGTAATALPTNVPETVTVDSRSSTVIRSGAENGNESRKLALPPPRSTTRSCATLLLGKTEVRGVTARSSVTFTGTPK